jgi:hypothetical protein
MAVVVVFGCFAALLLCYGSRVVFDVPLLDDWGCIGELQRHLAGESSLPEYLCRRHNEHLVVPTRLAFLLLFHATALDLRVLRWLTIATFFGCAVIVTAAVWRDLERRGPAPQSPAGFLLWLPVAALTTSLASWETIVLAMTFTNAFALLATLSAVLAFDRWRERPSIASCLSTFGLAGLATISLGSGFLLWFVFAIAATCCFRFAQRRVETSLFWLLGLCGLVAQAMASNPPSSFDPGRFAAGAAVIAGVPLALPGTPGVPDADGWQVLRPVWRAGLVGAALLAVFALAVIHHLRADAGQRSHSAKYVLWGGAGFVTCLAIAWARHGLGTIDDLAASRYVPMVLPLALGGYGYWIHVAPRRAMYLVALAILCVTAVADVAEYRMGRNRAGLYRSMIETLRGDVTQVSEETWRTQFFLQPWLAAQVVHERVPFLRTQQLSLFR